jgi:hypothetical protein
MTHGQILLQLVDFGNASMWRHVGKLTASSLQRDRPIETLIQDTAPLRDSRDRSRGLQNRSCAEGKRRRVMPHIAGSQQ